MPKPTGKGANAAAEANTTVEVNSSDERKKE
jgi:hypothetical protein